MTRRVIHFTIIVGLLLSAMVSSTAVFATEAGATDPDQTTVPKIAAADYSVYLPWVPHGVPLADQGEYYGAVVVQNLEPVAIEVEVAIGLGQEPFNEESPRDWLSSRQMTLSAYESITLDAVDLHIPQSTGASVRVSAVLTSEALPDSLRGFGNIEIPARIAALAKTSGPAAGSNAVTTSLHDTVDGYTGLTAAQITSPTNGYVLPIVQNNSGWETKVRVAHMGDYASSGYEEATVRVLLFEAGESDEIPEVELAIRPGGVGSFILSDHVPLEWVGAAVIESDAPIGAIAERVKHSERMLVSVVSRPEQLNDGAQYAPLVFRDYHDWNTGISIANTNPYETNEITVTYYGPNLEAAGQESITVPPRGMNFIHSPGGQDGEVSGGFVGSAMITGTTSFHAVVDQVKYGDGGLEVGQAMSYVLEPTASKFHERPEEYADRLWTDLPGAGSGTTLALPLVQRGNPEGTGGDMSGIQLFNTSSERSVQMEIVFYDSSGAPVSPTVAEGARNPMLVTLGANQSYTLYTPSFPDMPPGFQGSAIIEVTGGGGGLVGISNNVNYDVRGDGSAAFSLVEVPPAWERYDAVVCGLIEDCRIPTPFE